MLKVLGTVFGPVLILVVGLAGGCALVLVPLYLSAPDGSSDWLIWAGVLAVAIVALGIGAAVLRAGRAKQHKDGDNAE